MSEKQPNVDKTAEPWRYEQDNKGTDKTKTVLIVAFVVAFLGAVFSLFLISGCAPKIPFTEAPETYNAPVETVIIHSDSSAYLESIPPEYQVDLAGNLPGRFYIANMDLHPNRMNTYHGFSIVDTVVSNTPFIWGALFPRGQNYLVSLHTMTGAIVPQSGIRFVIRETNGRP